MKKIKLFLMMTVLGAGLSGCSSVNQGVASAPFYPRLEADFRAELNIMQKATAQASRTVLFGIFNFDSENKYADGVNYAGDGASIGFNMIDTNSKLKSAAAYKVLQQSRADVLVAPVYTVYENNYLLWKNYTVVVHAYPAKISRILHK